MNIPLQQTKKWQKLQTDLGEKTFFEEDKDYTYLAIEKKTKFGTYLYLPYGPYTKTKNAAKKAYEVLEALGKREGAVFIRVEPQALETAAYWANLPNAKKTKDLSPKETWILDLSTDEQQIIADFTQGTRTCYNQFPKKGLSVKVTKKPEDIHYLVDLQHKLAREKGIGTFSQKYLETELKQDFATLYLVYFDPVAMVNRPEKMEPELLKPGKKVIAASLFFDYGDTRYYMQSAANMDYKRLPATVGMLTAAIFDAKKAGLKHFDFWGIAPENAPKSHPWAGFTTFKKSFGGYEVNYCGTYDLILNARKYRLYKLARVTNQKIRKIFRKKR